MEIVRSVAGMLARALSKRDVPPPRICPSGRAHRSLIPRPCAPLARNNVILAALLAMAPVVAFQQSASASHIPGATYSGTLSRGGGIKFVVSPSGSEINGFSFSYAKGARDSGSYCVLGGSVAASFPIGSDGNHAEFAVETEGREIGFTSDGEFDFDPDRLPDGDRLRRARGLKMQFENADALRAFDISRGTGGISVTGRFRGPEVSGTVSYRYPVRPDCQGEDVSWTATAG